MRTCVSSLVICVGLLVGTAIALGQAPAPTIVTQAAGSDPSSGVLTTPSPAPVPVPPSGVLSTTEHPNMVTLPFKWSQNTETAKKPAPVAVRGHMAPRQPTAGRVSVKKITTAHQGIAVPPPLASTPVEQPSQDQSGYELLLAKLGKGKVSK